MGGDAKVKVVVTMVATLGVVESENSCAGLSTWNGAGHLLKKTKGVAVVAKR